MRYPAVVTQEDGAFVVVFPANPGCQTQAEREDELLDTAREALEGWLEATLATGDAPPVPPARAHAGKGSRLLWIEVPPKLAVKIELRRARRAAGLTQAQLAARAGVSQQQIAQLEHPDSNPTLETLERVARALGARLEVSLTPQKRAAGG
jgi:predicted RNase H-like HicB family nuclease/DNA-binding XRE family transcriptional regulator